MTATLEYGYRTGRHDPQGAVKPAADPEPRNTSVPQAEGLQAEKVIKGLFTGTFNFDVHILAAANRTPLTVTGSSGNVNNDVPPGSGPIFGADFTMTKTAGFVTLIRGTITPAAASGDSFLFFRSGTTTRWRLTGDGRILMPNGFATSPTLSFLDDLDSGIHRLSGIDNRWFLDAGGVDILEVELVAAGVRRIRVYGTSNSVSQPHVTHGGGYSSSENAGLWFFFQRVSLVNGGAEAVKAWPNNDGLNAGFRTHVDLGGAPLTAAANQSAAIVRIGGQQTRATSGAHPQFNTLQLDSIDDGAANAGLLTDSTTLYIGGAPATDTQGKVTNFRAIWVRAPLGGGGGFSGPSGGGVDFDGDLIVTGVLRVGRGGQGNPMVSILFGADLSGAVLNMVKAGAGNHPHLALLQLQPFTAGGVATHTDATALHIVAAPNTSPTGGKNRAIWVQSGTGGGLVEFEGLFRVNSTFTAAAGASATLIDFTGTLTEAASGNHARLSLIEFGALGVTAGAATVTDATTVYIAGAPAGVVTGKNRALWVVAGEAEFGGIVTIGLDRGLRFANQTNQAAANVGTLNNAPAAGDPAVWIPVVVNGVNRAVPAW